MNVMNLHNKKLAQVVTYPWFTSSFYLWLAYDYLRRYLHPLYCGLHCGRVLSTTWTVLADQSVQSGISGSFPNFQPHAQCIFSLKEEREFFVKNCSADEVAEFWNLKISEYFKIRGNLDISDRTAGTLQVVCSIALPYCAHQRWRK